MSDGRRKIMVWLAGCDSIIRFAIASYLFKLAAIRLSYENPNFDHCISVQRESI